MKPGESGGLVVRPYALTGGRATAAIDLALETLISTTGAGWAARMTVGAEQRRILLMCGEPMSIAEVAARMGVPLGVARVLVGDMVVAALVELHGPYVSDPNAAAYRALLEKVLDGISQL